MPHAETLLPAAPSQRLNVADRLTKFADAMPDAIAVASAQPSYYAHDKIRGESGAVYETVTFAELDADATRITRGLAAWGVPAGTRLALLVKPGIEFVTLVFALLRAGLVIVLVDPGLGKRNLVRCLADAEPEGFVAIGVAQAVRAILRHKFPRARWNVTVGRKWLWDGKTLDDVRLLGKYDASREPNGSQATKRDAPATRWDRGYTVNARADDPAAIIFTSGSTGPPKGVLYTHRMFDTQVEEIQSMYNIEPGGIDLACFPLFALFNAAMGVTTVLPKMDFSRPASAKPKRLLAAANDWKVTQAFASPAVWRVLSNDCAATGERIDSLRQVFSCGAPVPADVIRKTLACVGAGAKMHTPYGATECLPVSTIDATEVLSETAALTDQGAGVCVGRRFDSIEWRVIQISDDSIECMEAAIELPVNEIGELVARGPQISPKYVTQTEFNERTKIRERAGPSPALTGSDDAPARFHSEQGDCLWHRTGDVGYFDALGRFWYCGRKSQRVQTASGPLFTECVEGVFNRHPDVESSALVGIGRPGDQLPVIAVKLKSDTPQRSRRFSRYSGREALADFDQLAATVVPTSTICDWMDFEEMPVDIRHNAKIAREFLREGVAIGILAEPKSFHSELVARARQSS